MAVKTIILLFPAILIAVTLFIGIIILLVKGSPTVRWSFGIFLVLLVIGFFGLFNMKVVPRPIAVTQPEPPDSQLVGASVHIDKHPAIWTDGLEEDLIPDAYSSLNTAAYGLGVQLQETMDGLKQSPKHITILENDIDDIALLEKFRSGLQYILPDVDILIASNMSSGTQISENIRITIKHQQNPPGEISISEIDNVDNIQMSQILHIGNKRGSLQAVLQTTDNKFAKQVEYDSRSWLQDVETFRSHVGRGQWAVIMSDETAISKEQARQQLYNNANKRVYEHLIAMGPIKRNILLDDLTNYGFIVDEYYQRFHGLSGPIWRAAMLLDVSPERIQILRQHKITVNQIQRKTWIFQVFSLVGMLALISVLYLFVNAITKGYYSTTILIVAIIAFLVFLLLFTA